MKKILLLVATIVLGTVCADAASYTVAVDTNAVTVRTGRTQLNGAMVVNNSTQAVLASLYDNATLVLPIVAKAGETTVIDFKTMGGAYFATSLKLNTDQKFSTAWTVLFYENR